MPFARRLSVRRLSLSLLSVVLVMAASAETTGSGGPSPAPAPAIFTPATVARAEKLLGQMTPEEKIGQLSQFFYFAPSASIDADVAAGKVGSLLFVTDPKEIARLQKLAVDGSRLHIPLIFGYDVIHGFRTIFPVPLAMASSWDPAMVERSQAIAAAEANSVGINWAFAPMVDIARDPRWGRIVEGAGEDPYLGAAIARAQVRGFQGPAVGTPNHLIASVKHFAGYGMAEGGRDYDASSISDADLENIYLAPFHAAVQQGAATLMSAYMDLNGVPATGNKFLLSETLRDSWGFKGFVVSDANAVKSLVNHGFAKDPEDAAVRALTAGVNMEMALDHPAYATLSEAVAQHLVTPEQIDHAVLPILEAKIQMGLFEHPYVDLAKTHQVLDDPAHRSAARLAAERSAVLLKNEGNLLPLPKGAYKSVAVIGPLGDSKMDTIGSWAFQMNLPETVTLTEGLKAKLGAATTVKYAEGVQIRRLFPSFFDQIFDIKRPATWTPDEAKQHLDDAVALAGSSDLVVLALGETWDMSGEAASRSSLDLPGDEEKLLEAVTAAAEQAKKPLVLVLQNGRPLNLVWANDHVPAILEAWYGGTQGGAAIANLLFGDATPGGKLPVTFPRNVGQIPIYYAHNLTQDASKQGERYWNEPSTPLYPFGYGLTYSTFAFSKLKVTPSSHVGQTIDVSVTVENTGSREADEVVQLYTHQQYGSASRPVRELKGFRRITLAPKATTSVHFTLSPNELRYFSAADHKWVEDASPFDLWVGEDSTASLHTTFTRLP